MKIESLDTIKALDEFAESRFNNELFLSQRAVFRPPSENLIIL